MLVLWTCRCKLRLAEPWLCVHLQNVWQEVLRCVSRWELLQQIASGGPTDALLFAAPAEPVAAVKRRNFFSRTPRPEGTSHSPSPRAVHVLCGAASCSALLGPRIQVLTHVRVMMPCSEQHLSQPSMERLLGYPSGGQQMPRWMTVS